MRGRKPTPTALKVFQGNPGKRPLNGAEPQPTVSVPAAPAHLTDEAVVEWNRVAPLLAQLGLMTEVDRAALAAYCNAWARWVEAETHIVDEGYVLRGSEGGTYQNPWLAVANKAIEQMHKFMAEFGMTPSSRTRLSVPGGGPISHGKTSLIGFANEKHG